MNLFVYSNNLFTVCSTASVTSRAISKGYFRLTAFGDAEKTKVAAQRIKAAIKAL